MNLPNPLEGRRAWSVVLRACAAVLGPALACWLAAAPPAPAAAPVRADLAVQVSFDPAGGVRLRGQRFVARPGVDIAAVNDLMRRQSVHATRLLQLPENAIDSRRSRMVTAGRRDVPDLNRHYRLVVDDTAARDRLLRALRELSAVDQVIAEPEPAPPPATPNYTALQRFAGPAPVGTAASTLSGRPGGQGQQVKLIDIEYSWNTAHEDLASAAAPGAMISNGTPADPFANRDHGTAVLGLLTGTTNNGFGISGLAPAGAIGMVNANSTTGWTLPNAVSLAHQHLQPGDVMLLEQQVSPDAELNLGTQRYVAAEYWPAVYDAIRLATQDGIVVVEAAGNGAGSAGGVNLDDQRLGSPFPRGLPDSGAIIVGAGSGDCSQPANARLSLSAYGSRVNLQGWGQCVATTGYGDLFNAGENARYTQNFSGTSSASAVVAGVAALYSSVFEAEVGRPPSPRHVRSRLMSTGTSQGGTGGQIGPLPNLAAAMTGYDATPPSVVLSGVPSGATSDTTPTFQFSSGESDVSFACRLVGITSFGPCAQSYTTSPLADGAYTFEVRATDAAFNTSVPSSRAFVVDTAAPTASITAGPAGMTGDPTPTFEFAANEPGVSFQCRVAGAATSFAPCASPHTESTLADGAYTFEVRASDPAGNTGQTAERAFTLVAAPVPPTNPDPITDPAPVATPAPAPVPTFGASTVPPALAPVLAPTFGPGSRLTARVARNGTVRLSRPQIRCPKLPASCIVTARAVRAGGRAAVASGRLVVRPDRSATIPIKLTSGARAILRRRGRLDVKVKITARQGSTVKTRTVAVTLKR